MRPSPREDLSHAIHNNPLNHKHHLQNSPKTTHGMTARPATTTRGFQHTPSARAMRLLCLLAAILVSSSLQCHGLLLLLPLTNTLSSLGQTNGTSIHHLIRSSSLRSAARHGRHRTHHLPSSRRHRQLSLPLAPGSDYTLSLSVGPLSTASPVSLFLDTGSDLVWFPCAPFTCMLCEGKPTPPGNNNSSNPLPPPIDSRRISCASPLCSAAHSSAPPADLCAAAGCPLDDIETGSCAASSHACPPLYYAYGDGSLVAHLRRGRVGIGIAVPVAVDNFTFACAHTALGEPVGVAGFGRGPLSLPAQLAPALSGRFSYCLVAHSFRADRLIRPSPLILGRGPGEDPGSETGFVYTPLLHNPKHPYFYSVALEAVSVGRTRIRARPELGRVGRAGDGGMVVDSGTTFTMLPNETYARVAEEFGRAMAAARFERAEAAEEQTGLSPCYYYDYAAAAAAEDSGRAVPLLALHFRGNATVALPRRNYFMGFRSQEGRRVGCLMLMNGGADGGGGPAGTLGNFQQQGFEVVYDVDAGRVGFARRRCTDLWDSLSRR